MAKTYIDIVKYMVEASFTISGLVEKPDIIGAVFGQTEGLLGGGLDLRELQKNGKIGRIEIDSQIQGSRTAGKLFLPSSLGRVDTCILAAAIESVDRVGPFETQFKVNKIEDTRTEKRRKIVTRAKELLKTMLTTEIPDSKEISELVESDVKAAVVTTYGPEALPAGPEIANSDEVIFVEGRADVINLLKNDIDNTIAVGGAIGNIPKTIIELSKAKEVTIFADGDRGGDMIIRGLLNVCDVQFIARAPDGKEVEELTRKDIIKALRSRVPVEQVYPNYKRSGGDVGAPRPQQLQHHERPPIRPQMQRRPEQRPEPQRAGNPVLSPTEITKRMFNKRDQPIERHERERTTLEEDNAPTDDLDIKDLRESVEGRRSSGLESIPSMEREPRQQAQQPQGAEDPKYVAALTELHNTLRGRIYDSGGILITEVPIRDLIQTIQDSSNIGTVVFDGIITQRLIELAARQGAKAVYGIRAGQITRKFDNMLLYTKEHGRL
ncbi:MAG: DNA primase [Candidatus Micrarchaeota archaeon]|nr:DNA primase [Candidatus Micrarchaeota archaeon]